MDKKKRNARASNSSRCWFISVYSIDSVTTVAVFSQDSKKNISQFSKAKQQAQVKPAFGAPVTWEVVRRTVSDSGGKIVEAMRVRNRKGETDVIPLDLLCATALEVNDFTGKIAALHTDKKDRVLAEYLSLMACSKGF